MLATVWGFLSRWVTEWQIERVTSHSFEVYGWLKCWLYLFDPGEQAAVVSHKALTVTEGSQWILTHQAHISANEALWLICQKKNERVLTLSLRAEGCSKTVAGRVTQSFR